MNKHIWRESYSEHGFPAFPCPKCRKYTLRLDKDTLKKRMEPIHDGAYYDRVGAFSGLFRCINAWCGNVVSAAGKIVPGLDYDQDGDPIECDYYSIKALVSDVPVIDLPKATPAPVQKPIKAAFSMLWADRGAAANKLRISVECVLDHFQVPKRSRAGGRLTLARRIELFEDRSEGHLDTFDALREVGNTGSHEGDVTFDAIIKSFDIYEDALRDLFSGRKAERAAIVKELKETRGRGRRR
ncbi:DUF4145 domain-containing protein [Mesorhizobium sp.]|uniref:DUF4145 domain-containing protein n=1 Tax=Mesorhizobium sp. TaxID=1871066 RepID=UPI0025B960EF|nr:DUF4145 domain-containing protein [Mesorhizobium sp.]